MELTIFDKVIFGSLQPWQSNNQSEQFYSDLLRLVGRALPNTVADVNTKLQILLRNHPGIFPINTNAIQETLQQPIFSIAIPEPNNIVTEYYLLLLECAALHFLDQFKAKIDEIEHEDERYYEINFTLEKVKYIAIGADEELERQGFKGVPDFVTSNLRQIDEEQQNNIHYILYAARQLSIRVYFEIQELFEPYVKNIETPITFYRTYFKKPFTPDQHLNKSAAYFNWKVRHLVNAADFSFPEAGKLLLALKDSDLPESEAETIITALENFFVAAHFNIEVKDRGIEYLAETSTTEEYFGAIKEKITSEVNQLAYGHQRFDLITQYSQKLSNLNKNEVSSNSALTRLRNWLNTQADAYKTSLSSVFSIVPDDNEVTKKKSKPLSKIDKTTIEDLKQQAQEFLLHFSGFNVQQKKIMSEKDFQRLMEYTFYLLEHEKLPKEIKPIPTIELSGNHIRYTFYLMHKSFYGTNEIKPVWIDFLQKVFQQLSSQDWQTLKTKFSVKPNKYDNDIGTMKTAKEVI